MGVLRADGHLHFVGRYKDMLKVGGENVDPMEVEALLWATPRSRAPRSSGGPTRGCRGRGSVRAARARPTLSEEEVIAHCRGHLASFKIPRHVAFVDEFPMTSTGKIQKVVLRERAATASRQA